MKVAFIIVLFNTKESERKRLNDEIKHIGFADYSIHFIDNSFTGKGYATGANEGIRRGIAEKASLFILCNPDISFTNIKKEHIIDASKHFDVAGFAMKQDDSIYYGGIIDKWRMSGGLIQKKPKQRFAPVEFVTGSLLIFSKKVVDKIGFLDEDYFMYYEDVDFSYRAKKSKLKVGVDTDTLYEHFEVSKESKIKDYWLAKSRLLFLLRYGSIIQKIRECIRAPRTIFESRKIILDMLINSLFVRNFFSLNISSIINKLLHFALFITMVRFIPLKDYGIYTLVWAHVNLFSPLTDFGTTSYGMVYLPREDKSRVYSLFTLRMLFSVVIFFVTLLAAFIFHYSPGVIFFVFIISSVIFYNMTSGMYLILSSISGSVVKASVISILTSVVMMAVLVWGAFVFRSIGAIFNIASFFYLSYALLYFILIRRQIGQVQLKMDIKEWVQIMRKSYIFVLISLFAGIYFRLDVFILNFLKGPSEVGIYSSGYKFLDALILFASSYNTISAPSLSKTAVEHKKLLFGKILKHALFLTCIGFGAVFITLIFGNVFLPFILKGNYLQAIPVVRVVVWAIPFILYNSIFLNLLYASDLSYLVIWVFIFAAIINAILNFIFIPHFSYMAPSYITVISELTNLAVLSVLVFIIFRKKIFYD